MCMDGDEFYAEEIQEDILYLPREQFTSNSVKGNTNNLKTVNFGGRYLTLIDIVQPGLEGDVPDYSRGLEQKKEEKKALKKKTITFWKNVEKSFVTFPLAALFFKAISSIVS